jgi:hypothetical protein
MSSQQTTLMSTNSFGSPDLDQRPAGMARSTIESWLQECPYCGYVAECIDRGDAKAKAFLDTEDFRAVSQEPSADPAVRRFLVRAAQSAYEGDRRTAFTHTLAAAWIADDKQQPWEATVLRLRAAQQLGNSPIRSIYIRLELLDVLRRASNWDRAAALASELAAEGLEHPFAPIVAFHRDRIEARDNGRYTIEQAIRKQRGRDEANAEMVKLLEHHLRKMRLPGRPV